MLTLIIIASLIPFIACRSIQIRLPDEDLPEETPSGIFQRSDSNHDNKLSFDEFLRTELVYVLMKKDEFERYDTNKDGMVSRSEYDAVQNNQKEQNNELRAEYFAKLFEEFDEDFDMKLNEEEVRNVLAKRFLLKPRENFSKTFKMFDKNEDGGLDIAEYINFDENVSFEEMDPISVVTPKTPSISLKKEKLPLDKKSKATSF